MLCQLYQWQIEKDWDDNGRITLPRLLRHLDACPNCQRWVQSLKQIDALLQIDASGSTDAQIEKIQNAVLQRLSRSETISMADVGQKTLLPAPFKYALSAAAAVIIIAVGWLSFYITDSNIHEPTEPETSVAQLTQPMQYQIPILAGLPDALLESQMQTLQADARRAINFVQNCLPRELLAANFPTDKIDAI